MNRLRQVVLTVALLGLVLGAIGILAIAAAPGAAIGHAVITIGDHEVALSDLVGGMAGVAFAAFVVALVLVVVVPVAIAVPLLAVGVGLAVGFLAIAFSLALLLSPLIVVGWLIWRVARPAPLAAP